ncbi:MAG TPA: GNAT family N-acetyltransferase [Nocardioidaceae bacterium]|nr:GNAT family N-acetyltransferase [Nocardioidaceae bacterium]
MTRSEQPAELVVRPARPEDIDGVAAMFSASRRAAVPSMPPPVHTVAEDRAWLADQLAGEREAWLAEQDGQVVGLLLLEADSLHSLYVDPGHQGEGIGSVLVDLAKTLRPRGLELWVFQSNEGARRLYARHGFVEVEETDGRGNDEGAPDVRMQWRPAAEDSVAALRRRIDAVDDRLARLLDERAVLTARIQVHKATPGQRGRDAAREREIVTRMAERAPHLGRERLGRIMHVIITESLDAAEPTDEG